MLITTSLLYVLFNTVRGIFYAVWLWVAHGNFGDETVVDFAADCYDVSVTAWKLTFAYNFYVYLITGKQFRSDLHKLLCRCSTSSSPPPPAPAHVLGAPPPAVIAAAAAADDDDDEVARCVTADTAV